MIRHLILIGLPGAGKSSVGRLTAQQLPTDFTDIDEDVEREAGRSISSIFERMGEAAFRQLERAAMARALAARPRIIAAGAGWVSQPGNLAVAAEQRACVVYLRIAPQVAGRRLSGDDTRPLLSGGNQGGRLEELLAERKPWYERAEHQIDADAELDIVAARVLAIAKALA